MSPSIAILLLVLRWHRLVLRSLRLCDGDVAYKGLNPFAVFQVLATLRRGDMGCDVMYTM
jgi:hypothetical protein